MIECPNYKLWAFFKIGKGKYITAKNDFPTLMSDYMGEYSIYI